MNDKKYNLNGKKVLLMGLGALGGGLATAKWLLAHGAELTITDLRNANKLKASLVKLNKKRVRLVLGKHREADFLNNDIVVVNPGVSFRNKFVILAKKHGKQIENELTLFYRHCRSPILAVTGTRGKTTTANWLKHFIRTKYPRAALAGNSPDSQLLAKVSTKSRTPFVLELPSFLLEFTGKNAKSPDVAIVTNIYRDHLNRYRGIKDYALAKVNIFKGQTKEQRLILNADNDWTDFFLKQKPKSKILFFSLKPLKSRQDGIFVDKNLSIYIKRGKQKKLFYDAQVFIERWGRHNLENLLAAALAANTFGVPLPKIIRAIDTLPQIRFREQTIFKNKKLEIVNDTAATSPEATIAAVERFVNKNRNLILIAGGTDKDLDYKKWAMAVKKYVKPENLIFLNGSATKKMAGYLGHRGGGLFENLKDCLNKAVELATKTEHKSIILFSPGAKSFEKFKHEFDRGEQFNFLVKKVVRRLV
ncbi:MAG: UDP-N-acetylmuramoyl-L-alanine--D-glutamate ligase [bacterium]|nr:UDP-N-acetylmuramoyl-L-alanine--D-glutamate ligase [bacterium]